MQLNKRRYVYDFHISKLNFPALNEGVEKALFVHRAVNQMEHQIKVPLLAHGSLSSLLIACLKAALGALNTARLDTLCPHGIQKMVGNLLHTRFSAFAFRFLSPVRRRVAEAGQGISARTV